MPAAGQGKALLEEARALQVASTNPSTAPATAALSGLAAALLAAGEAAGPTGSPTAILGLKLSHRLAALDSLLISSTPSIADQLKSDARVLAATIPDPDAAAAALRDVLAPLVDANAPDSPGHAQGANSIVVVPWDAALVSLGTLTADERIRLVALRARLDQAAASPAYREIAAAWSRSYADVMGVLTNPPAFLTGPARAAWTSATKAALLGVADHAHSEKALNEFARLSMMARIARDLESPTSPGEAGLALGSGTARAQHALNKTISSLPPLTDHRLELARVSSLARAAALIPVRRTIAGTSDLVRQLKPAMRTLNELAKLSENELAETLPDAFVHSDAATLPKFVSAQAEHRRRLDDLGLLRELDSKLGEQAGAQSARAVAKEFVPVAERALSFSKDVLDLARKDDPRSRLELIDAMDRWRRLAARASDVARMPGESELRRDGSPVASLLSPQRDALLKALDADRAAWIRAWAAPDRQPPQAVTDRLERIRQSLAIAQDAAAALGSGPSRANRLSCWEMSAKTRLAATEGLQAAVQSLVESSIAGGSARNAEPLPPVLGSHGLALVIGRLERHQSGDPAPRGAWHVARELTAGSSPLEPPLADRASDLSTLARYSPEWAQSDSAGRRTLMQYLGPAIARCLAEIQTPADRP